MMVEHAQAPRRRDWIVGMIVATHPFPSAMNGLAAFVIFLIADHAVSLPRALLLLAAVSLVHASIGSMNDYVDEPSDRLSNPDKPLVRGLVSRAEVLGLLILCGGSGLALSFELGPGSLVAVLVLAAGMAYNMGLKGTWLSWLPYAVFIPSVAVWAFLAAGATSLWLLVTYPLGALLAIALNLANTLPDLDRDAAIGLAGLTHRLGAARARLAVAILFVLAGVAMAAIDLWAGVPVVAVAALSIGLASAVVLNKLFSASARDARRVGWYAAALAGVMLAGCWALTLDRLLGADR